MSNSFEKRAAEKAREPEQIKEPHIAVFGQGHFGSRLFSRLDEIKPPHVSVEPISDRLDNAEAAFRSDLLILAVRPEQVRDTLQDMNNEFLAGRKINPNAQVLSFASGVPIETIAEASNRPSARMMADPWWNVSAYVLGRGFSKEGSQFIFNFLTDMKPIKLDNDDSIERFTLLMCQLFVAELLKRTGKLRTAETHRTFVAAQKEFACDPKELSSLRIGEDPARSLRMLATPGGISKRFLDELYKKPKIEPADLFLFVSETRKR